MSPCSRLLGFSVVLSGLAATIAVLFHAPAAKDVFARTARPDSWLTIVDGSQVEAGFAPAPLPPEPHSEFLSSTNSPVVLTDGWTMRRGDSRNLSFFDAECYTFNAPTTGDNRILFNSNFKIPRGGVPNEVWGDLVVFTCTPRIGSSTGGEDAPPPPAQAVVFDDIQFGNPGAAADPYQVVGFVTITRLEDSIGLGDFDWILLTDSAGLTAGDDDGDGAPDVALGFAGSRTTFKLRPTVDELGAAVIELFARNVRTLNIFEPAGTYPPGRTGFAGMLAGETGHTRPWCFRVQ